MKTSRHGRTSPITGAYAADMNMIPTTGGQQLCYYSENFNSTEAPAPDDAICHDTSSDRDMTKPGPGIPRASGAMQVPLDFNHLGFFLPMLMGAPELTTDGTVTPARQTRVFSSGKTDLQLAAFGLMVTDDQHKLAYPSVLNTFSFGLAKQDGFRRADLGFLTPNVVKPPKGTPLPGFMTASPVAVAHKKAPGVLGTFEIEGTVVANLQDGNFSYSNQGELIDLADGQNGASGHELGDTLIRTDVTLRVVSGIDVNDVLEYFQGPVESGGTPFASKLSFVLDANASLEVEMPYCVGERRAPTIGGAQRQSFQSSLQAYQDGANPAARITLVNQVA